MTASTVSAPRRIGLLVGLAYAAFIGLGLPDGLTSVAWPSIRAQFGLPLDALGALVVASAASYLFSSFISGWLLARMGVGTLLVLSCLTTAAGLLGYAVTPSWPVMVALGLAAGLGAGAIDAGLNAYAAENFNARTVNWLHASFGLGAATGPLIMSGVIGAGLSWRLGYLLIGVAQVVLATCFVFTRSQWHAHVAGEHTTPATSAPLRRTLALPSAWLGIVLFFVYTGLELSTGQWLYSLLTEARGVAPVVAGIWVSAYWGSLTVGRLLSGVVIGRVTVRTLLYSCMVGAITGTALLWLDLATWATFAGVALLGLSLAPIFPSLIALTPERIGAAHAANTVGFQIAAAGLGGAALTTAFGFVATNFGLEQLGSYAFVLALLMTTAFVLLDRRPTAQV
jgi:fucose permease